MRFWHISRLLLWLQTVEVEAEGFLNFFRTDVLRLGKLFAVFPDLTVGQVTKTSASVVTDKEQRSGDDIAVQSAVALHAVIFGFFVANDNCIVIKGEITSMRASSP